MLHKVYKKILALAPGKNTSSEVEMCTVFVCRKILRMWCYAVMLVGILSVLSSEEWNLGTIANKRFSQMK